MTDDKNGEIWGEKNKFSQSKQQKEKTLKMSRVELIPNLHKLTQKWAHIFSNWKPGWVQNKNQQTKQQQTANKFPINLQQDTSKEIKAKCGLRAKCFNIDILLLFLHEYNREGRLSLVRLRSCNKTHPVMI